MSAEDRLLMVSLTLTEYEGGKRINEAKLTREGQGDYLLVAKAVLEAIGGHLPGGES